MRTEGTSVQGAVANSSGISVGWSTRPLTSERNGSASSEIWHQPALMWPGPHISPFSSHFSLELLVSKHQEGGEGCAFCHGFLCGSVHTNGMPEWQNLTPLLQNALGSRRFPNQLRLHATPSSFHPGIWGRGRGAPATASAAPAQGLRKERGRKKCIKLFNL